MKKRASNSRSSHLPDNKLIKCFFFSLLFFRNTRTSRIETVEGISMIVYNMHVRQAGDSTIGKSLTIPILKNQRSCVAGCMSVYVSMVLRKRVWLVRVSSRLERDIGPDQNGNVIEFVRLYRRVISRGGKCIGASRELATQ